MIKYRSFLETYFNIFNRCDLPTVAVYADVGMMGGSMSHEYMYLTPIGEDTRLGQFCKQSVEVGEGGRPVAGAQGKDSVMHPFMLHCGA